MTGGENLGWGRLNTWFGCLGLHGRVNMNAFFMAIDPYLIWFYRISGYALVDFFVGTFVLASIALIMGEVTISLAFLAARRKIDAVNEQMTHYQNMSLDALKAGDKKTYLASNKLANDAFGKSFFMQIALSAAFLWPIFFSLEWMKYRFSDVEFELLLANRTVGYMCVFITVYAAAYLVFKRIKYRLPHFRNIKTILDSYQNHDSRSKALRSLSSRAEDQL